MRRVVVGTAGHIDHGKTRLVEALTGIDCDRWAEEKERGITIDLGFAHLRQDDLQVGFVDVPGHERFLHNALAGLGGIRIVLLVVAADEGVKPQTREHLDVCQLLRIPRALVALTKADLVDPELRELAQLEVEELLEGGPLAGSPVIAVSSLTGEGLPELRSRLLDLADELALPELSPDADAGPVRLPVDRAFHLKGSGVIVTGTLVSGRVRPGDTLELLPAGERVRVRSIQVHGEERGEAQAGERTSLQLSGTELERVERGMQLTTPGAFAATQELCCRLRLLPSAPKPIKGFAPVRLHHFASEVVGKIRPIEPPVLEPGGEGLVEIRLSEPVVAQRGDRTILRRPSPAATLGGGEVLDPAWRRRRGKERAAAALAVAEGEDEALLAWVADVGERGVSSAELALHLGGEVEAVRRRLAALAASGRLLALPTSPGQPDRWLAPAAFQRVLGKAKAAVADFFRRDRMARGMPKAELVQRILPARAAGLAPVYLDWLAAQKVLALDGDLVTQPGRGSQLTEEESRLAKAVEAAFDQEDLGPPSPAEMARRLNAKQQIFDGVVRYLIQRGRLVRLPDGLILAAAAVERLAAALRAGDLDRFTVSEFKDRFGLSRKWAIPLLEHLDSRGVTRRLGDQRVVVREG